MSAMVTVFILNNLANRMARQFSCFTAALVADVALQCGGILIQQFTASF